MSNDPFRPEIPHHMNRFVRNRWLYDYLFEMGLSVDAVLLDGNPDKIDSLIVATAPRKVNLQVATDVASPVEGAQVGNVVASPGSDRNDVVDSPKLVFVKTSERCGHRAPRSR